MSKNKKILITGPPGIGKTTVVKKLYQQLVREIAPKGFYTEEIRERGRRVGFQVVSFSGQRDILAHVRLRSPFKVGRYYVNVEGFERFLNRVGDEFVSARVVIIDEIGKMECFSPLFIDMMRTCLDSSVPLIATVAIKGGGFIREVKERPDVTIFNITLENRDRITGQILNVLKDSIM